MRRGLMSAIFLSIIILSFTAIGAECSFSTANLSEYTMCTGVEKDTYKPVGATDTFKPDTPTIYVTTKLANAPSDTLVKFDWYYLEDGETFIDGVEVKADGTRYLMSNLSKPTKGWPTGKYEVRVFLNGKEANRVPFTVK